MKYLDVHVVISPARDGDFEVNVSSDAGGEGNSALKLPFAMRDLSGVMFNRGGASRAFDAVTPAAAPVGTASSFGVQLFEALFQGETREVLSRTENEAKRQSDTGVRIRLSMNLSADRMAEVASLPWELMRRRDQSPLVVSVQTPVVRAFDTPKPIFLQPMIGKLRILALVSNPRGTATLNLDEEKARIGKIWARLPNVEVDFAEPVEEDILSHLADHQYHVIHYMGHGDFDSGAGGLLMMERTDGSAHLVTGETFAGWLADEPLRLVFLNACNTGTTGEHNGLHPFAGVASALIRSAAVPAVVAMQFPITDKSAIIFAQTFYERIAQAFPVDAAVGEARKRLYSSEGSEWATPVLYMRAADGNLFGQEAAAVPTPRVRGVKAAAAAVAVPVAAPVATPVEAPVKAPVEARVAPLFASPAPVKWYKKPMVLGGAAAAALLIVWGIATSGEDAAVVPAPVEAGAEVAEPGGVIPDPANPATAAIAAVPAAQWINDDQDPLIVDFVLKKATLAQVQELADAGYDKAQYVMAAKSENDAAAAVYYAPAARQGLAVAEQMMGEYLAFGIAPEKTADGQTLAGVVMDEAAGRNLLNRAAAQGNRAAADSLASLFSEIVVVPDTSVPDPANPATAAIAAIDARRWRTDQANEVDPPANIAQSLLAVVPAENIVELAQAGNAKASYVLARMQLEGLGGEAVSLPVAATWMAHAARAGIPEAMFYMGTFHATGVSKLDAETPAIERNDKLAKAWFKKAGDLGNPVAAAVAADYDANYPPAAE